MVGAERGVERCWDKGRERALLRPRMMGWIVCDCVVTGIGRESRGLMHARLGSLDDAGRRRSRKGSWTTRLGHCGRRSFGVSDLGCQAFGVGLNFGKSCMEFLYILLDRGMINRDQCFLMYVKLTSRENVFRCVKRWHSFPTYLAVAVVDDDATLRGSALCVADLRDDPSSAQGELFVGEDPSKTCISLAYPGLPCAPTSQSTASE